MTEKSQRYVIREHLNEEISDHKTGLLCRNAVYSSETTVHTSKEDLMLVVDSVHKSYDIYDFHGQRQKIVDEKFPVWLVESKYEPSTDRTSITIFTVDKAKEEEE